MYFRSVNPEISAIQGATALRLTNSTYVRGYDIYELAGSLNIQRYDYVSTGLSVTFKGSDGTAYVTLVGSTIFYGQQAFCLNGNRELLL